MKEIPLVIQPRDKFPVLYYFTAKFSCQANRSDVARELIKIDVMRPKCVVRSVRKIDTPLCKASKVLKEALIDSDDIEAVILEFCDLPRGSNVESFSPSSTIRAAGK